MMKKKRLSKILWVMSVVGLSAACARSFITGLNSFSVGATASYSGATFSPQPSFTFAGSTANGDTVSDSVTLGAYSDAACSVVAPGSLVATQNPLPVKSFSGSFAGVSYTCANHLEETVYIRAKSTNAAICSSAGVLVSQHFNAGQGFVVNGATGAAGGTAGGERDQIAAFAVDSVGRYIGAGSSKNAAGGTELALWRYNPDGTLDTTFGTTGEVVFGATGAAGATGASEDDVATTLAVDSSGNIVVAGFSVNGSGGKEIAFWRYTTAGVLDTTLGSLGYIVGGPTGAAGGAAAGESDSATSLILDSSGNFVFGGFSENAAGGFQAVVWRYTSSGTLDTTFNTTGILSFGATGAAGGTAAGEVDLPAAVRADSTHYILAGTSKNAAGGVEQAIWRFDNAGTIDATFGAGTGAVAFGTTGAAGGTGAGEDDLVNDMELDSTGNYVIAGSSKNAGGEFELAIWRYTSGGVLDVTFNTTGVVIGGATGAAGGSGAGEKDQGFSLKFDGDQRLMVSGASKNAGGGIELALWRYTTAGVLDTTFNTTGHVVFGTTGAAGATAGSENDAGDFLIIDGKGRFVISGSSANSGGGQEAAMWRYLSTGVLEI